MVFLLNLTLDREDRVDVDSEKANGFCRVQRGRSFNFVLLILET